MNRCVPPCHVHRRRGGRLTPIPRSSILRRLPDLASHNNGRLLLSARLEDAPTEKGKEVVHSRKMAPLLESLKPRLGVYRLKALIIAGDELPIFSSSLATNLGLANSDVGVCITLAGKVLHTPRVKVKEGQAQWNYELQTDVVLPMGAGGLPARHLPDTFIYLYRGEPGERTMGGGGGGGDCVRTRTRSPPLNWQTRTRRACALRAYPRHAC